MVQQAIADLVAGRDLTAHDAAGVTESIMTGEATPAQIGSFLTAMRIKGETAAEIAGMARVMRDKALRVSFEEDVIDTCGTGGDGTQSINVSTIAALVAVGAGLRVAKHGNRAFTSEAGSADVLEAAGVKIELGPASVERCLRAVGMGFMFAPTFHPAMRFAGPPRREIGIRTVFNILGPLTNPAGAQRQVLGVADGALGEKMAQVLRLLGSQHALVVHGEDGMDEVSISAPTQVWELKNGDIHSLHHCAGGRWPVTRQPADAIRGRLRTGERASDGARAVRRARPAPRRGGAERGCGASWPETPRRTSRAASALAAEAIDSGRALAKAPLHGWSSRSSLE